MSDEMGDGDSDGEFFSRPSPPPKMTVARRPEYSPSRDKVTYKYEFAASSSSSSDEDEPPKKVVKKKTPKRKKKDEEVAQEELKQSPFYAAIMGQSVANTPPSSVAAVPPPQAGPPMYGVPPTNFPMGAMTNNAPSYMHMPPNMGPMPHMNNMVPPMGPMGMGPPMNPMNNMAMNMAMGPNSMVGMPNQMAMGAPPHMGMHLGGHIGMNMGPPNMVNMAGPPNIGMNMGGPLSMGINGPPANMPMNMNGPPNMAMNMGGPPNMAMNMGGPPNMAINMGGPPNMAMNMPGPTNMGLNMNGAPMNMAGPPSMGINMSCPPPNMGNQYMPAMNMNTPPPNMMGANNTPAGSHIANNAETTRVSRWETPTNATISKPPVLNPAAKTQKPNSRFTGPPRAAEVSSTYPDDDADVGSSDQVNFKNDGSFFEMFKKMKGDEPMVKEEVKAEPEPVKKTTPKFIPSMVGKRRGGRVLKTGMVEKLKKPEEDEANKPKDAWSLYMAEVKKYREANCEEEVKTRALVK